MDLALGDRLEILDADPALVRLVTKLTGTPWFVFQDAPVEFVRYVLGESSWSGQDEILQSVWDNERTIVAACHGPGKTHIMARIVAWWVMTHPVGMAQAITTAPTWRQVKNLLWMHISRLQIGHGFPGKIGQNAEWRIGGELVAFGFSPSDHDEAAAQGIHSPYALVAVDEAGGISRTRFGSLEGIMSTGFARIAAIGNPPTNEEGTAFEERWKASNWHPVKISAFDTPNFTGEVCGPCNCPEARWQPHTIAKHLTTHEWVEGVEYEFGIESGFYIARVKAEFPEGLSDKTIPWSFIEAAQERDRAELRPKTACALGVDVASDGGDELAFAVARGFDIQSLGGRAGADNADPMKVALRIREHIEGGSTVGWEGLISAQRVLDPYGRAQVRIDAIGLGWAIAGLVDAWAREWMWPVDVVPVNVAEKPNSADGQRKFARKRDEMWWNAREGCRANWRLTAERRALSQMNGPEYTSSSQGLIVVESKESMRKRGLQSPDQAEAILLAGYDDCGSGAASSVGARSISERQLPNVRRRPTVQ